MKVIMVLRSQAGVPGAAGVPGGQIGMVQLARALAQHGADVELFVGGPRMGYLAGIDDVSTTYLRWPLWLDRIIKTCPSRAQAIGANLRRGRWLGQLASLRGLPFADVIHIQGLQDAETLLTRFPGPVVVTHWGRVGRWQPNSAATGIDDPARRHIRDNVRLVAIGEVQAKALTAAGMPPMATIPPGVELRHFRPGDRGEARHLLGLPADASIVLYVGRLARDKNVSTLLKAFARIPQRPLRTLLLIVGDGPLRTALQHLTKELGIDRSTMFLPFVAHESLPLYYRASNVTAVPSDQLETFCMVGLEAIACGCPLIVTDQVPEILRGFPSVPSVAPYDIGILGDQLARGIAGEVPSARDTDMASHDWGNIARQYLSVYQTALRRAAS